MDKKSGDQAKRPMDKKLGDQAKRPMDKKLGDQAKRPMDKKSGKQAKRPMDKKSGDQAKRPIDRKGTCELCRNTLRLAGATAARCCYSAADLACPLSCRFLAWGQAPFIVSSTMPRSLVLLLILLCLPLQAAAFGPGMHVREAQSYVAELRANGGLAAEDLALFDDPALLELFLLGSIYPDISRNVPNIGFPSHDPAFARVLLLATRHPQSEQEKRERAFFLGNAQHLMSDISAQLYILNVLAARTGVGAVDLFIGAGDGYGGENELIYETMADVYMGSLHDVVDLYFRVAPSQPSPLDVKPLARAYYALAIQHYGNLPMTADDFALALEAYLRQMSEALASFSPSGAHLLVDTLRASGPEAVLGMMQGDNPLLGALGVDIGEYPIDPIEKRRLAQHPYFADGELYSELYAQHYAQLGPALLREHFISDSIFDDWPIWHGPAQESGAWLSLAVGVASMQMESELMVFGSRFFDAQGEPVNALSATASGSALQAQVELFATTQADLTVLVRIRGDRPSFDSASDPILAEAQMQLQGLPATLAPPTRQRLDLDFTLPSTDDLLGLYVELIRVSSENTAQAAFASGARKRYLETELVDLERPAIRHIFAGLGNWRVYLPIEGSSLANPQHGQLELIVRNRLIPTQPVPNPALMLGTPSGEQLALSGNAQGRVLGSEMEVGEYTLEALDADLFQAPTSLPGFTLLPGRQSLVELSMEPLLGLSDEGDYLGSLEDYRCRLETSRFPEQSQFVAAWGRTSEAADTAFEALAGALYRPVLSVEEGERIYCFARLDEEGAPVVVSDGIVYDPSAPQIALELFDEQGAVVIQVEASDPVSGVQSLTVSGQLDGLELSEQVQGERLSLRLERSLTQGNGSLDLVATAQNGAGSSSEQPWSAVLWPEQLEEQESEPSPELAEELLEEDDFDGAEQLEETTPGRSDDCSCRMGQQREPSLWSVVLSLAFLAGVLLWRRKERR
ncbi:MAG: hypothetical protein RBU37_15580 [Myxococcota bacterium]|jgi:hypothetical protein|nr:hypothetical protein [Myxococcota bacterium]